MKKILFLCLALSCLSTIAQPISEKPKHDKNAIQLAILLDVSGSMDGLIEQAKAELWSIVNEASKASKNGQNAKIEIALYEYGRSAPTQKNDYISRLLDFTTDLDTISEVLFSLRTSGSEEFCGEVIYRSLNELAWNQNDSVYKVIFIAGNEIFNQGRTDYKKSCTAAAMGKVIVNTIHCGDSLQGIVDLWKNGAEMGKGKYFFINQNAGYNEIETPYDSLIKIYNDSLNTTYWGYGSQGIIYKTNQITQDGNAMKMGKSVSTKRAMAKSKAIYDNSKWDANDAYKQDTAWLINTADEELPAQIKGKTVEEKKLILTQNDSSRAVYTSNIGKLARERDEYIKKKKALEVKPEHTLGTALIRAIHEQASARGFKFAE